MFNCQNRIKEIRAFSVQNLLEGAALIEAPDPKDPLLDAINLIQNFENRSSGQEFNAITDWNGDCFCDRMGPMGTKVVTRAD